MPEPRVIPPSVDFSKIPDTLEGKWVVFREQGEVPLGAGDTPAEALAQAEVGQSEPGIILARVPSTKTPLFL